MLDALIQLDKELFLWLNNNIYAEWINLFWLFATGKLTWLPLYVFFLSVLFFSYKPKSFIWILVGTALVVLMADQGSNIFKYGIARLRPCHDEFIQTQGFNLVKGCGGKYGYFSAHSANTFAVAVLMMNLLRDFLGKRKWMLILWAFIVAYSRIYVGVHYPLDIISGAIFGMMVGFVVSFALKKLNLLENR